MAIEFQVKRIYDEPDAKDGIRLLADRLWPRGVSKQDAKIDLWAKELTPSNELRKWFHAHADQRAEFTNRYELELRERLEDIIPILDSLNAQTMTLVTATKDLEQGHVAVLKRFLDHHVA